MIGDTFAHGAEHDLLSQATLEDLHQDVAVEHGLTEVGRDQAHDTPDGHLDHVEIGRAQTGGHDLHRGVPIDRSVVDTARGQRALDVVGRSAVLAGHPQIENLRRLLAHLVVDLGVADLLERRPAVAGAVRVAIAIAVTVAAVTVRVTAAVPVILRIAVRVGVRVGIGTVADTGATIGV